MKDDRPHRTIEPGTGVLTLLQIFLKSFSPQSQDDLLLFSSLLFKINQPLKRLDPELDLDKKADQ